MSIELNLNENEQILNEELASETASEEEEMSQLTCDVADVVESGEVVAKRRRRTPEEKLEDLRLETERKHAKEAEKLEKAAKKVEEQRLKESAKAAKQAAKQLELEAKEKIKADKLAEKELKKAATKEKNKAIRFEKKEAMIQMSVSAVNELKNMIEMLTNKVDLMEKKNEVVAEAQQHVFSPVKADDNDKSSIANTSTPAARKSHRKK